MVKRNVRELIKRVVQARLQSVHVLDVLVDSGEDFDGDDIILVKVVVNAPASSFDPKKMAGLVRHLRDALAEEADEHDFPMVSYVTHRDLAPVAA